MVYAPSWLSDVYWQIEELITLNLLLIVDGIMLDGIDVFASLDGVYSELVGVKPCAYQSFGWVVWYAADCESSGNAEAMLFLTLKMLWI